MSEFLNLLSPQDALSIFLKNLADDSCPVNILPTITSLGRVLASDVRSPHPMPNFPRSTVDGYAVNSSDTYGASDSQPAYLNIIGEIAMGTDNSFILSQGQTVIIHTGGMIPSNANAVVMIEDTQLVGDNEVEIRKAVASGDNVLGVGEDIEKGAVVISTGTQIRSVEIGGLVALGIMDIPVYSSPRVGIISNGDEVVQPDQKLLIGQVRDVNSYLLSALITRWGGDPVSYGIVKDNFNDLIKVAKRAIEECDAVIFTAGSSVSIRDITAKAIESLGEPGVLVHGVNIRPGKPTILAVCSGKAVIGLPGNPVSAFVAANLFVSPLIKYLLNLEDKNIKPTIRAKLTTNMPSQAGREDWVPVKLEQTNDGWKSTPIFSKSNFIFSLVSSDGMICIQSNRTGMEAGEFVDVFVCQ